MTPYRGSLRGVVLDWSGTVIDHGSRAPALVFVDLFRASGVAISVDEARGPMGTYKRDHIAALLTEPSIRARWETVYGCPPTEADIDTLFADFNPRQIAITRQYTELIPGALDAVAAFRARGLKIGTCTGYTRAIMDAVAPIAAAQGFIPDSITTPEEVPAGRPAPYMIYLTALKLAVYPLAALVKIGDTPVDIEEGLHAGVWTVGLACTGNELGLSADEVAALDPADRDARLERARANLRAAGAHYVVDSLADVPALLDDIDARLARGERP